NGEHLVCSASGKIVGFDPLTGQRLWESAEIANNTSSTPVPAGSGRFFLGASEGRGEGSAATAANASGLVQILAKEDGSYHAEFVWRVDKANCSFGSPVVAAGKVWIVNRSGALYQLDLETGERLSVSRVKSGSIWATPLVDPQHIYFFG